MTTLVTSPRKPMSDAHAQIDCEAAIDVPVREFIDSIIQAGWPPQVAFSALKSVVENLSLAYAEEPDPADAPLAGREPMPFPLAPF